MGIDRMRKLVEAQALKPREWSTKVHQAAIANRFT